MLRAVLCQTVHVAVLDSLTLAECQILSFVAIGTSFYGSHRRFGLNYLLQFVFPVGQLVLKHDQHVRDVFFLECAIHAGNCGYCFGSPVVSQYSPLSPNSD